MWPRLQQQVLEEILEERVESSRGRRNPRGVRQKMSSYKLKRRGQHMDPDDILFEAYIEIIRRHDDHCQAAK